LTVPLEDPLELTTTTLLPGFRWVIVAAVLAAADAWVLRRSVKAV